MLRTVGLTSVASMPENGQTIGKNLLRGEFLAEDREAEPLLVHFLVDLLHGTDTARENLVMNTTDASRFLHFVESLFGSGKLSDTLPVDTKVMLVGMSRQADMKVLLLHDTSLRADTKVQLVGMSRRADLKLFLLGMSPRADMKVLPLDTSRRADMMVLLLRVGLKVLLADMTPLLHLQGIGETTKKT